MSLFGSLTGRVPIVDRRLMAASAGTMAEGLCGGRGYRGARRRNRCKRRSGRKQITASRRSAEFRASRCARRDPAVR